MLTQAPLPGWINILRAIFRKVPSDVSLARLWCREGEIAGWLSRSTWSLALIVEWRMKKATKEVVRIWLPDYFCNSALQALRNTGVELVFYPVSCDLTPDEEACRHIARECPPDVFLLVHYFGMPSETTFVRDFCARHHAWMVEDATHALRPMEGIGTVGDFVLYSPHKSLPMPDGAVLVVRPNGPAKFGVRGIAEFGLPMDWPSQLKCLESKLGDLVRGSRTHVLYWTCKRIMQQIGIHSWRRRREAFAEPVNVRATSRPSLIPAKRSAFSMRLLAGFCSTLGDAAGQRRRHQMLWDELLRDERKSGVSTVAAPFRERVICRSWTPYLASYAVDPTLGQMTLDNWIQLGYPVTTWPDLPPEVKSAHSCHVNAIYLRNTRLYLAVHQSLRLTGIYKGTKDSAVAVNAQPVRLVWNGATETQWHEWLVQVGKSNLLQSWAYGEAKSETSGWSIRRGVFFKGNEPIAMVQVLQKKIAGVVVTSRINRGPLYLRRLDEDEQEEVLKIIGRFGDILRGRLLSIAPELVMSGPHLSFLLRRNWKQFSPKAWESAWVDLGLELKDLRSGLEAKWRNMLSFSEKTGLHCEIGTDDHLYDWMILRYKELIREQNFTGIPVDTLNSLRRHSAKYSSLIIIRGIHDDVAVAGIGIALHGCSATYLIGWNGLAGRKMKANQFIIWQSIIYLKQLGIKWFDLGGIDTQNTPGIAAFKGGLRGSHYELVGEYWKW